ncbi:hypothetical protein C6P40_001091 [Pichia californica]|uniref:Uncharacterized protein n=1 Tax=Pichia californica TaxID=460514 RepID=A0A9P6WPF4_9ASCO|nr:hypothetical protein C6P40_001091 [[Candida] californica]
MSELHEVEPEPITTLPGIPASLPKNGTTHPYLIKSINILSKFQQYSVMPFSVFSIIHLSGVVIGTSIFGPQIGDDLIGLGREIYQVPIIEIGIFISAGIHVISGISINLLRKYYNYVKYGGRKSKKDENREKFQNLTTKPIKNSIDTNGNNSEEVKNIDEGLGGIGSIIGIGSRKSITSRWLGLSPLAFSGYLFLGLLIGHVYYERIVPIAVDGDSSMTPDLPAAVGALGSVLCGASPGAPAGGVCSSGEAVCPVSAVGAGMRSGVGRTSAETGDRRQSPARVVGVIDVGLRADTDWV